MAYSVIDKVYTIFIDVMTGSSNGYGKPTFYNTDSHTSFIELTVTNGSKEFNMTEFSYMFTVEKPDGTKYTNEYTTQDKSKLVIPVDAQMISCTGNCNAQLYVNKEVDGVNKTLTMVEFNYTVYKGLHEGLVSESIDFDNVYVKILNKLDYIINNGADLTGDQAQQLADAYRHSQSPHAPANIVETMHTEIGEAIDEYHKKVTLSASQVGGYEGADITVKPSQGGLTKDIIIKGKTLQNVFPSESDKITKGGAVTVQNGIVTISPITTSHQNVFDRGNPLYKPNTMYTIVIDIYENTLVLDTDITEGHLVWGDATNLSVFPFRSLAVSGNKRGRFVYTATTRSDFSTVTDNNGLRLFLGNKFSSGTIKFSVMILEGDYTQPDAYIPPYFEGIKCVGEYGEGETTKLVYGSHGKNLINLSLGNPSYGDITANNNDGVITLSGNADSLLNWSCFEIPLYLPKGTWTLNYMAEGNGFLRVSTVDAQTRTAVSGDVYPSVGKTFQNDKDRNAIVRIFLKGDKETGELTNRYWDLQLEEGIEATAYEPYQEDVKEVTAPIKGGIKALPNGVKDDVYQDTITKNNMIVNHHVGEYTFTGDEEWSDNGGAANEKTLYFFTNALDTLISRTNAGNIICNTLPTVSNFDDTCTMDSIFNTNSVNAIRVRISKDKLATPDVEGFKAWLKANPTTIYYELANKEYFSIEVPQGGNLKTYEGATHVFSKNDFKPVIYFSTDFASLTTDAKQYCIADDGNKNFILPDVSALETSSAIEIHLFVEVKSVSTLSFPSEILWDDSTKLSNIIQGSVAEFIFTYIKTADGNMWVGTVVTHK